MPNPPRQQFEENWRKRFEKFASNSNDDAGVAGWSSTGLETRLRFFQFLWELQPTVTNALWLDAGCGAGTYSRFLVNRGMRVVGMDYSLPTLQKAVLNASNLPVIWCAADATKLPVKKDLFNGVLCFGVVQALSNSDQLITELAACVKSGGEVWIDALNGKCLPHVWERFTRWLRRRPLHLRYESSPRLKDIMQTNGLTEIELFWLPMLPTRWNKFQWLLETSSARWIFHYIPGIGTLFSHAFILRGIRK
jgi:2-polyprenyl-3-methyl-5-hydroxy-6-metoxy-1,4-benzoquinol methylase